MKNLVPLNNSYAHFERIAHSKRNPIRGRLNNLKPQIRIHYISYNNLAETDRIEQIPNAHYINRNRAALLHCYTSKTSALAQLKIDIKLNQSLAGQTYCQYCMAGMPSEYDHYIPKEEFCEYSVLALNLIPCCTDCNRKKSAEWLNAGSRIFLNLYYDHIVSYRVLFCRIQYSSNVPIVRFSQRKSKYLSNAENNLIKEHYLRLDLLKLFQDRANVVISETVRSIESVPIRMNRRQIVTLLRNEVTGLKKEYGINYWKALIKLELSKNDSFLRSVL